MFSASSNTSRATAVAGYHHSRTEYFSVLKFDAIYYGGVVHGRLLAGRRQDQCVVRAVGHVCRQATCQSFFANP